jgi:hypothetical protein
VRFTEICTDDEVAVYAAAERLRLAVVAAKGGVVTGGDVTGGVVTGGDVTGGVVTGGVVTGGVVTGGKVVVGGALDVAGGVEPVLDESPLHADNMARRIHAA